MSDGVAVQGTGVPGGPQHVGDVTNNTAVTNVNGLIVKIEKRNCLICSSSADNQCYDLFWTETQHRHSPLVAFICRIAEVKLSSSAETGGGVACQSCFELINVLEKAEIDFCRLKEDFIAAISESPVFESCAENTVPFSFYDVTLVKTETKVESQKSSRRVRKNSDDEPLATKRQTRKGTKKKASVRQEEAIKTIPVDEDADSIKEEIEDAKMQLLKSLQNGVCEENEDNVDCMDAPDFSDDDYVLPIKVKTKNTIKKSKQKEIRIPIRGELLELRKKIMEKRTATAERKKEKSLHACPECPAKYSSTIRLSRHMMGHEMGKPPYICEVCGASYKHKKACDIHVRLHKGISDWKCDDCDKLFPSKGALHRHNAIHTGKSNYQCDLCGKSFIHLSSFKMHKLSHSGLKAHTCDVCGLALMTRSHLKRHKRVHSGEKRHECPICGKKFSERYNMLAHQKSHDAPPEVKVQKTWKGFHCYLCDHRFERKYMLERHMELIHERILEKEPPKPRNTMTKLLKAQAAAGKAPVRRDVEKDSDKGTTSSSATTEDSSPGVKRESQAEDTDGSKLKAALLSPEANPDQPASGTFTGVVNGAWQAAGQGFVAYGVRQNEFEN